MEYAIKEGLLDHPDPFTINMIEEIGSFEGSPEVTDASQIQMERRLINLPLRGQTNLLILRAQPGSKVAMDLLENAVRSAERFMEVPFPTDQVTLRFTESNVPKGYAGTFMPGTSSGGQVQILPTIRPTCSRHNPLLTRQRKTPGRDNCPRGGALLLAPLCQLDQRRYGRNLDIVH